MNPGKDIPSPTNEVAAWIERSQAALAESERRHRDLVAMVPGAVYEFRIDSAGRRSMPFISEGIVELVGLSPAEIVADVEVAFQRIPASGMPAMEQSIRTSLENLAPWLHEFPIRTIAGEEKWLRGHSIPRREADGSTCWSGVFVDITSRRRTEEARTWLATIVESSQDGIISRTPDGTILSWNAGAQRLFGYTAAEAVGRNVSMLSPPERQHELRDRTRLLQQNQDVPSYDTVRVAKDGRRIDVQISPSVVRDDAGNLAFIAAIFRDISERKRSDEVLRESEQRFREVTEAAGAYVMETDLEHRLIYVSERVERVYGYRPDEMLGRTPGDFMPPGELARVNAWVEGNKSDDGSFHELEHRILTKGGEVIWQMVSRGPRRDANGTIIGYRAAGLDFTERKHAELALRESEDRYRDLVENSQDLICTHDLEGRLLSVNPAVSKSLGYSRERLLGMKIGDMLTPAARELFPAYLAEIRSRGSAEGVMAIQTAGGKVRYWEYHNTLRKADVATPIVRGMARDITERRRAERAMAESEERFRILFEQAAVGVAEVESATGRYVRVNQRFADIVGYTIAEMLQQTARVITHRDDLPENLAYMERLRTGGLDSFSLDKRYHRKDGSMVWVNITVSPMRKADGTFAYHSTIVQDITERRQVEEALRLLSTDVVHLSGAAFFDEVARKAAEFLKVDIGFVGRLLSSRNPRIRSLGLCIDGQVMPPVEYDLAQTPCEAVVGKNAAVFSQDVQRLFPASRMLVDLRVAGYAAIPLFDMKGHALGHIGVMSRVPLVHPERVEAILRLFAVRVAAEIERQGTEAKFHDLFAFSPEAILMVTPEGRIVLANREAEILFGYSHEELLNLPVENLVPEASRQSHVGMRERFFSVAVPRSIASRPSNLRAQKKDGTTFPVDISLNPLQTADGMVVATTVRDTSARDKAEAERKLLEIQLRQSQKMEAIGTLAGGVAHDFNNILAAIIGNAELARQDVGAQHPALASLNEIRKASRRAKELIDQILAFSRRQPQSRQPLTLAPLVEEVVKLLRATLPARVEITLTCADDTPYVMADPTQVHQVLLNLGTNAWHALEHKQGRIDIRLEAITLDAGTAGPGLPSGRYVHLSVRDNGCGMDAATLERVFEPFFTTKSVGTGTGLGLSVVHGIMQAHQGVITIESTPGSGTTVHLYFPAIEGPAGASAPAQEITAPLSGSGQHVLYLDDEEALVLLVTRMLERLDYHVSGYTEAEAALAAVRADPGRFDLVVTDYNMPGMSGLDVADELSRIRPDLPVAITSGYISDELRQQSERAGVRHLIYKPNTVEELCEAVRKLTDA